MSDWRARVQTVVGVDFSGAKAAGDNIWMATLDVTGGLPRVRSLDNLGRLVGSSDREVALPALVERVVASRGTLWGIDFPFALPLELFDGEVTLERQLAWAAGWEGTAMAFGRECVARCQARLGRMHVRRATDIESRTPFDCYHYRIIHQTFHGMREVIARLRGRAGVSVLPFDAPDGACVWVGESCPGSTLKRWGLPHANYKQPAGGALTPRRRATRAVLYAALRKKVRADEAVWRTISRNPGGDALDALVAGLGVWEAAGRYDAAAVAAHPRYSREGLVLY